MKPTVGQSRTMKRTWILIGDIQMLSALFLVAPLPLDFLLYGNIFPHHYVMKYGLSVNGSTLMQWFISVYKIKHGPRMTEYPQQKILTCLQLGFPRD